MEIATTRKLQNKQSLQSPNNRYAFQQLTLTNNEKQMLQVALFTCTYMSMGT